MLNITANDRADGADNSEQKCNLISDRRNVGDRRISVLLYILHDVSC